MEYLENHTHVLPLPGYDPEYKTGDIGILECWEKEAVFLIVQFSSETDDYKVLAKCADKFLAHSIREACEEQLDREAVQKLREKEEWDCSRKAVDDNGLNYCLDDSCPYRVACPNYLP